MAMDDNGWQLIDDPDDSNDLNAMDDILADRPYIFLVYEKEKNRYEARIALYGYEEIKCFSIYSMMINYVMNILRDFDE
jgi:hypothetical protein